MHVVVVVVVARYLNFMNTANHSSSHNCRSFARNSQEFHRWVWCHYHPWYRGSSLINGHPQDMKKVLVTGAGCLQE